MPLLPTRTMTDMAQRRGSSLVQDPQSNSHNNHLHLHDRTRSLFKRVSHERRQDDSQDSAVTEVVQTVELVQVLDEDGMPIDVQTIVTPVTTRVVDPASGDAAADISTVPPVLSVPSDVSVDIPAVSDIIEPGDFVIDSPPDDDLTSSSLEPSSTGGLASNSTASTSTRYSSPSGFPTLVPAFNGTNGFWNASLATNSTGLRQKSKKISSATLPTTTETSTETPVVVVVTATAESAPGSGAGIVAPPADADTGSTEPPPTSTVVGISFGSIAGAALLIFVVMAFVRWKRRQSGLRKLGDGPTGQRGLLTDGNPDGGMTQRPTSYGMPNVLASLSAYKQQSQPEAPSEERGFYRVSGKKLPSVLEHGGDGYTDPRQSVMSGTSSYYRESHIFDAEEGRPPRLALGSPMRPVSGVPVMRSGPARTPVTEGNPFSDPPSPASMLQRDPLGRSLTGQDGSHVSSSRFAEEV